MVRDLQCGSNDIQSLFGYTLAASLFIALIIAAGTLALFGDTLTNPSDIVERVDSLPLTIVAALTFFAATVGINLVANFIPPAYDLANLFPSKISFKVGGLITAIIAPFYGIIVVDYYLVKKRDLDIQQLFSSDPKGAYYYVKGWNQKALIAFGIAVIFSVSSVWVPALAALNGYACLIGAGLGGLCYYLLMPKG